ncbi:MAG: hypothetical protein GY854_32740 [Deltaproteobacteria bacterium]|nr:hypothetical protein [Deltaproteobacteria bacterium]
MGRTDHLCIGTRVVHSAALVRRVFFENAVSHCELSFNNLDIPAVLLLLLMRNDDGKIVAAMDLLVPEFIENSNLVKNEPWFPVFMELASKDKTLLIQLTDHSYLIVFKKDIMNP